MKVLGLILELNPPHNGHHYFIDQAKKLSNADICIAVITSSFSMRGDISVIDKFAKAKEALNMGIDYIFEYPYILATQSADYFGNNAVKILASLGITDIAFGVELDNLNKLNNIIAIQESESYNKSLKSYIDEGNSYGIANTKAFSDVCSDKELVNNASLPNNTLAISYIKALKSYPDINIHLIKRIENGYNDKNLSNNISSATSLRLAINNKEDITNYVINKEYQYVNSKDANDNLLKLLRYAYLEHPLDYFKDIKGVKEGLEIRISKYINIGSYDEFINNVKTKRYSESYLKRVMINMILGITNKEYDCNYFRLLAFNANKKEYLKLLSPNTKELIFSSMVDNNNEIGYIEDKVTKLYDLITNKDIYKEEYKVPFKLGDSK